MKKIIFFIICALFLGFFSEVKAFTVSPVKQIVTLEQGTGRNVKIKIRNTERLTTKYKISVVGVKQDDQGYPVYGTNIEEAEKWVRSEQEVLEIGPGKEIEASFKINIPKGTYPGSHYVGLSAEPMLSGDENKNFVGKLISLLLIEVSGTVNETLSVIKWSGERNFYLSLEKLRLNVGLKNDGNTELPIKGKIRLYNWLDKKTAEEDVFLGNTILPQTQRTTEVLLPDISGWRLPGVYRAQLDLVYGRTEQKLSAQYAFWYVSIYWLIVAGSIILVIGWTLVKKIKNKKEQENPFKI